MAGVLDKKSRFVDYTYTKFGRETLLEKGKKAFYVSLSDNNIVYKKDYERSADSQHFLSDISDYIAFEVDSNSPLKFNDLTIDQQSLSYNKITFNDKENFKISDVDEHTFSYKVKKSLIIETNDTPFQDNLDFKITCNRTNNKFDFIGKIETNKYTTLHEYNVTCDDLKTIEKDIRFSHLTRFKKMSPVTKSGQKILDDTNDIQSDVNYMFKSYKSYKNPQNLERNLAIRNIIKSLENDSEIMKKVYEVKSSHGNDDFVYEFFEIDDFANGTSVNVEKLTFINLGEIYDNTTGSVKNVYLIGKIINSRLYDANVQEANNNFKNTDLNMFIELSEKFSFINMFTMIVE